MGIVFDARSRRNRKAVSRRLNDRMRFVRGKTGPHIGCKSVSIEFGKGSHLVHNQHRSSLERFFADLAGLYLGVLDAGDPQEGTDGPDLLRSRFMRDQQELVGRMRIGQ